MNSWWCGEMDENEGGLCADAMVASAVSDAVVDGGAVAAGASRTLRCRGWLRVGGGARRRWWRRGEACAICGGGENGGAAVAARMEEDGGAVTVRRDGGRKTSFHGG
ncbi:hypothetical protein DEO72_LG3g1685 [Vigna unguiculata]|uniref:Uncharacterized protein n=1 Tax=Vigna unguiculata TaxID=3917 RepID=A0A4D6LEW3_VIGUN|nr:hypothetical protein DEO72_LG3g1685 [Vigna unguiculata]